IEEINNITNVLGTALVYHQIETGLDETDLETGSNNSQLEGEV
ncbi:nitrate reductase, partial [Vibrio sp. 10N.261.45.A7]